jgi:hypothetical protein
MIHASLGGYVGVQHKWNNYFYVSTYLSQILSHNMYIY